MRWWQICRVFAVIVVLSPEFATAGTWVMPPFSVRGVEEGAVATFRDLLRNEFMTRMGVTFVRASPDAPICEDPACAQTVGSDAGAETVVIGSLSTLGVKIIVSITLVDVPTARAMETQSQKVDQVEDLDTVASRIVEALATGLTVDKTAKIGKITSEEARPDRRIRGQSGVHVRPATFAQLYGHPDGVVPLVGAEVGYWYEAPEFAIEPRAGVHGSATEGSFTEWILDVGGYYFLSDGEYAPYAGAGAGLRHLDIVSEARENWNGDPLTEVGIPKSVSTWTFAGSGRVGFMLFRTSVVRLALSLELTAQVPFNGPRVPISLGGGLGVIVPTVIY